MGRQNGGGVRTRKEYTTLTERVNAVIDALNQPAQLLQFVGDLTPGASWHLDLPKQRHGNGLMVDIQPVQTECLAAVFSVPEGPVGI